MINLLNIDELGIPGEHNLQNFLAASTCSHLNGDFSKSNS